MNRDPLGAPGKSLGGAAETDLARRCWDYGYDPKSGECPAELADAIHLRLTDLTITEWAETDMEWWHEANTAVTAFRQGQSARHAADAKKDRP